MKPDFGLSWPVLHSSVSIPHLIVMQRGRSRSLFLPAGSGNLSPSLRGVVKEKGRSQRKRVHLCRPFDNSLATLPERLFTILETLSTAGDVTLGPDKIARDTLLPRNTARRLLKSQYFRTQHSNHPQGGDDSEHRHRIREWISGVVVCMRPSSIARSVIAAVRTIKG